MHPQTKIHQASAAQNAYESKRQANIEHLKKRRDLLLGELARVRAQLVSLKVGRAYPRPVNGQRIRVYRRWYARDEDWLAVGGMVDDRGQYAEGVFREARSGFPAVVDLDDGSRLPFRIRASMSNGGWEYAQEGQKSCQNRPTTVPQKQP